MSTSIIFPLICIGCFVLYWVLDFSSTKAYRWGYEILGTILAFFSIVLAMLSAIFLILTVIAVGIEIS